MSILTLVMSNGNSFKIKTENKPSITVIESIELKTLID